jgi:hypothetical protein
VFTATVEGDAGVATEVGVALTVLSPTVPGASPAAGDAGGAALAAETRGGATVTAADFDSASLLCGVTLLGAAAAGEALPGDGVAVAWGVLVATTWGGREVGCGA